MIQIYIFNSVTWASEYGIGTYIQELVAYLSDKSDIQLNIVRLFDNKKEFEINKAEEYTTFSIPNLDTDIVENIYYRNAWYILCKYIYVSPGDSLYFHFNYYKECALIPYMKEVFPYCITILTLHSMSWCLKLKGNTSQLATMLVSNEDSITSTDKKILDSFKQEKQAYATVDEVICLSYYTEKLLMHEYQIPQDKISVIYNGRKNETDLFSCYEISNLKRELFIPENDKILLFVGRLDEIKGLSLLIKAFKQVVMQIANVHLIVIGDGNFAEYLKECEGYWAKVTFTGKLEKHNLYKFYRIADVGIMPSFHEQCSYVAIEMQMFAIPLITSDSTGLKEMNPCSAMIINTIEAGEVVWISVKSLSDKIVALLSCESAKDIGTIYYKHFQYKYSSSIFENKMNKIYRI